MYAIFQQLMCNNSTGLEISTEPEEIKGFKRKLLSVEEESSRHKTHANVVYN